jgi:hypothetical protein
VPATRGPPPAARNLPTRIEFGALTPAVAAPVMVPKKPALWAFTSTSLLDVSVTVCIETPAGSETATLSVTLIVGSGKSDALIPESLAS